LRQPLLFESLTAYDLKKLPRASSTFFFRGWEAAFPKIDSSSQFLSRYGDVERILFFNFQLISDWALPFLMFLILVHLPRVSSTLDVFDPRSRLAALLLSRQDDTFFSPLHDPRYLRSAMSGHFFPFFFSLVIPFSFFFLCYGSLPDTSPTACPQHFWCVFSSLSCPKLPNRHPFLLSLSRLLPVASAAFLATPLSFVLPLPFFLFPLFEMLPGPCLLSLSILWKIRPVVHFFFLSCALPFLLIPA